MAGELSSMCITPDMQLGINTNCDYNFKALILLLNNLAQKLPRAVISSFRVAPDQEQPVDGVVFEITKADGDLMHIDCHTTTLGVATAVYLWAMMGQRIDMHVAHRVVLDAVNEVKRQQAKMRPTPSPHRPPPPPVEVTATDRAAINTMFGR